MEHLALAAREIDDHAVSALDLVEVGVARFAEQSLGGEAAVLVGEELVLDRDVGAFLDLCFAIPTARTCKPSGAPLSALGWGRPPRISKSRPSTS
ncbi:hypothetical protein ACVOMV_38095 [Mesorhizobium atlanticum]